MGLYLGNQKISNLGETYTPLEIQSVNGKYSVGGNITVYGSDIQVSQSDSRKIDQELSSIPTKTSELENDSNFLTSHQELTDYYQKSELSTASEVESRFNTLSTYSQISDQLSNDGYALSSDITAFANQDSVAEVFDSTKAYLEDEVVMYNQSLYRCISSTAAGTLPTLSDYWEKSNVTDSDTAILLDDQKHLVIKAVEDYSTEYIDAYRFNSTSALFDATFNDVGTILSDQVLELPPSMDGYARDFVLIMTLSGDELPSFTFPITSSDLEPWSESIPEWSLSTTYRITFTETRPDKWEIHTAKSSI